MILWTLRAFFLTELQRLYQLRPPENSTLGTGNDFKRPAEEQKRGFLCFYECDWLKTAPQLIKTNSNDLCVFVDGFLTTKQILPDFHGQKLAEADRNLQCMHPPRGPDCHVSYKYFLRVSQLSLPQYVITLWSNLLSRNIVLKQKPCDVRINPNTILLFNLCRRN